MNDASLTQARRLWRFLISVRLALVLILIVVAASLAGSLIIQAPEGALSSPTSYERWVDDLRPSFGPFTGLMDFMGLFQIFQTWWFNVLAALLVLNLIACTINRFPATWRVARHPRINVGQGFFGHGRRRARLSPTAISLREMADSVVEALHRRRYRVTTHDDGDDIYVYGERNRYGRFGTFLTHGGIVLVLAAALWGNLTGFRDDGLTIPDGSVREVGHDTGLSVLNEGFIEEDHPDGRPKDYRSDLVIYDDGQEVKTATVRINDPVEYKGIRFHQAFFGNAAVMRVTDTIEDEIIFEDGVALAYRDEAYGEARPVGFFTLLGGSIVVDVVATAQDALDTLIQPWEVVIVARNGGDNAALFTKKLVQGDPYEVEGLEFTFLREKQFTGLNVVKTPGVGLLWLASGLLVLGMCTVLYFPYRRVWSLCSRIELESSLALAGAAPRLSRFDGEFRRLVFDLEEEMGVASTSQELDTDGLQNGEERNL